MGVCGTVRECARLREMAFVWRGVRSTVKVSDDTGRDQEGSEIER